MSESGSNQIEMLRQAIAALEAQRVLLGDHVVDASVVALRAQLALAETSLAKNEDLSVPKLVTCLVANLVTRDRDTSRGLKIMEHGFNLLAEVVRQYNSSVQGVRGNYLVALFSDNADDPRRTAYAALEMRQKLYAYNTELEQAGEGSIVFRAGLNIGLFAPSPNGEGGKTDTVTLDVAGVLSQYAPPNVILVSQQMFAYLQQDFLLESATPVEVQKKRIATFRLMEAKQSGMVPPGKKSLLPEPPFMGRNQELRVLLRQIEQFTEGGVIVISGEAGIGKTRLLAETRRAAPVVQWCTAHCQDTPIRPVYGVWTDFLMQVIGLHPTTNAKDIEKRLKEWLSANGVSSDCYGVLARQIGLIQMENMTPDAITRQMLTTWQTLLTKLVGSQPTVMVFEEVHAMDSLSLALLELLVEALENLPMMWVLVTQPLYNQPAAATVSRLGRAFRSRYLYMGLEPLSEEQTLTLLRAMLDANSLPDPLEAGIMERASGNVLMLQHVVRALLDKRGLIYDPKGKWIVTAAALQEYMPNTLHDVVMMRVRLLPTDVQELLQLAAAAGNVLFEAFLAVTPASPSLATTLATLRDVGLMNDAPHYLHTAIREIVYEGIPRQMRATLHRKMNETLAKHCELDGSWVALRAYHMDRGMQQQGALEAYSQARDWAYAHNALPEVADIIGAILGLLSERDTPDQVAGLYVEQQDILYQLDSEDPRCKTLLERAYEIWSDLNNPSEAAGVLLRMAVHHAGTAQEDDYYRGAQSLLERESLRHPMLPSVYLRRALFMAAQEQNGGETTAQEFFERARELARQLQDVETLAQIHFEMGLYLRDRQQLTQAITAFQQALSYFGQAEQPGFIDERVLTCNYLADLYYHLGHPARGEYFAVEAVANARRCSNYIQVLPYVTLSECYAAQARWQEAIRTISEAPEELAPAEMPPRFWLGRWKYETGDTLAGLEMMREMVPQESFECLMIFTDYLLDANFNEEADIRLHELKHARLSQNTTFPGQPFYDRLRGRLAAANKDFARAIALLDRAYREFEKLGFTLLAVSTQRIHAVVLLARCETGDDVKARSLLDEAINTSRKLSTHAELRRLQDAIRAYWPDNARY